MVKAKKRKDEKKIYSAFLIKRKYSFQNLTSSDCFNEVKKKGSIVRTIKNEIELLELILKDDWFKYTRYYFSFSLFFLYNITTGVYIKHSHNEMLTIISQLLSKIDVNLTYSVIKQIVNQLTICSIARLGNPIEDENRKSISFKNGYIHIDELILKKHSPEIFSFRFVDKYYSWNLKPTQFLVFLKHFTDNNPIRALALRSFLRKTFSENNDCQCFLYIYGGSRSGKTTFVSLFTYLIGDENTVISSLRALEKENFELAAISNSKLIVLSEIEKNSSTNQLSVLKSLTSGDKVRTRRKFVDGRFDQRFNGTVVCHSNHKLSLKSDLSQAISRRIRVVHADNYVDEKLNLELISADSNNSWSGLLCDEMVPILQWSLLLDLNFATDFLKNDFNKLTPDKFSNFVEDFVNHHVLYEENPNTFILVGGGTSTSKNFDENNLFPKFLSFMKNSNEQSEHITLSELVEGIVLHFNRLGKTIRYFRKKTGMCISNLKLSSSILLPLEKGGKIKVKNEFGVYPVKKETQKQLDSVFEFYPLKEENVELEATSNSKNILNVAKKKRIRKKATQKTAFDIWLEEKLTISE